MYVLDIAELSAGQAGQRRAPLRHLAGAGPDLRAAGPAVAASASTASSGSPASRSAPTRARASPSGQLPAGPRRPHRLAGRPAAPRVRAGFPEPTAQGRTVVAVGGLAKGDDDGLRRSGAGDPRPRWNGRDRHGMTDTRRWLSTPTSALYSAMGVFTIAMVAYAVYLAGLVPPPIVTGPASARRSSWRRRGPRRRCPPGPAPTRYAGRWPPEPALVHRAGPAAGPQGCGHRRHADLARLGLLLAAAAMLRALSVHRSPLGNMFEFALMGCDVQSLRLLLR